MRVLQRIAPLALASAVAMGCSNGPDPSRITASGHVEATEIRVASKVGGVLAALPIEEGDRVAEGQELARIDTVDLELALAAAQAERSAAQADLLLRLAGFRQEEIAEAEAVVAQVEADLTASSRDMDRMQSLLDAGSGTEKSRDDARARRDVNEGRLQAARERLRKLRAGSRPEEIDVARSRVAAVEARIAQLAQQIRDAVITSPAAGILTSKLVERGEMLAPGAPIAVVTDLAGAWLTVYVGGPDLARIRLGQEAEVRTDDGQVRKGRITFIASQAEFTPKNVQTRDERVKLVYRVKIGLDNADGLFKPGMPAEAILAAAEPAR
jgi:HlyD family secretion protein